MVNFITFPSAKRDDGTHAITLSVDGPMDAMAVADRVHPESS